MAKIIPFPAKSKPKPHEEPAFWKWWMDGIATFVGIVAVNNKTTLDEVTVSFHDGEKWTPIEWGYNLDGEPWQAK